MQGRPVKLLVLDKLICIFFSLLKLTVLLICDFLLSLVKELGTAIAQYLLLLLGIHYHADIY